jgi:hypothetical protein
MQVPLTIKKQILSRKELLLRKEMRRKVLGVSYDSCLKIMVNKYADPSNK